MALFARDVMKTHIVAVPPTLPLTKLEDMLIARKIGGAPVLEDGRLVGIVSRSDVVRYISLQRSLALMLGTERRPDPHLTVRDVMAHDPVAVRPEAPIEEVARLMVSRHVHRILVTEGDAVVGLISALDLADLVASGRLTAAAS
jgi:acetoin utilization protein AcuB